MSCLGVGLLLSFTVIGVCDEPLERVGRLVAPAIQEASGIVASHRHPGIFWVHNDSGNPAELFAVRRSGALVRSYQVAVPNVDWEDIATDNNGHLYLGDTGNNKSLLPIRVIHRFVEPDPNLTAPSERPLAPIASSYYRYADRDRFDAEGLVVRGNEALIVTKRGDGQPAEVYRLPLDRPAPLLRPLVPEFVGRLPGCTEAVTGATITADGRRLAVVTDRSVRVFVTQTARDWSPLGFTSFHAHDVEAITWDGEDLIMASEDRSVYRVPQQRWRRPPPLGVR